MSTDRSAVLLSPAASADTATRGLDDVDDVDALFFALVYSDEELVRDEFDALMAAAWSAPPPATSPGREAERPSDEPGRDLSPNRGAYRPRVATPTRECGARTRSPPSMHG